MSRNVAVMHRLALIRYLYNLAVQQSRQSEPRSGFSILAFHDSVEMFVVLATEQPNVTFPYTTQKATFLQYWDMTFPTEISQADSLTQKPAMSKLNAIRISLKHHGQLPHPQDVERCRTATALFFDENTPKIFGVDFSQISMADLVKCADARGHLQDADKALAAQNLDEASGAIALAFDDLLLDLEARTRNITLFPGGPTFPKPLPDEIRNRFNALKNALTIVSLGINYPRYLKFMEVMPRVTRYLAYPRELRWRTSARPSLDTCLFCYDFVVESALQLQEMSIGKEVAQE